jgi:hypothetical protein
LANYDVEQHWQTMLWSKKTRHSLLIVHHSEAFREVICFDCPLKDITEGLVTLTATLANAYAQGNVAIACCVGERFIPNAGKA